MKRLALIFVLCILILYSIVFCYADVKNQPLNILEDLPLVTKYEAIDNLKYITVQNNNLQAILAEMTINLNSLNYIYYTGSYVGSFNGSSLQNCLEWDNAFEESSPLLKGEIYKGYYKLRTEKILKQYQNSEYFDYNAFRKVGRQQFDNYIKTVASNQSSKERLTVLLQEKLLDKLVELEPMKKRALMDEVMGLGLQINSSKNLDCLYQVFESRVRLQMFDQMAEMNKQKLQKLINDIRITITSDKSGELLLQSKVEKVQIINVLENEKGYRGLTLLHELYGNQNFKLVFKEEDGKYNEIELDEAIKAIAIDENGFLKLDLNKVFSEEHKTNEKKETANKNESKNSDAELKALELLYTSKTKAAQEIVKELNNYSIYLELKNKSINNLYTRSFESKQKIWKKNLDNKLNTFGIGGMADFMSYIKQFELMDRESSKIAGEKLLIARYRNSDTQFRTTEECSIWLTNMLFKIKYMK